MKLHNKKRMSSSNHKKTNSNLFMQSSSVEKLHSKKGTWQRVNLKLKKKGLRATLTYSIKTKIHEVPLWIDKSRQANSKEIMAVDGMFSTKKHTRTHSTQTHVQQQVVWMDRLDGSSQEETERL